MNSEYNVEDNFVHSVNDISYVDNTGDLYISSESLSNDSVVIPPEIPNGPQFEDLSAYIDSVTSNEININEATNIEENFFTNFDEVKTEDWNAFESDLVCVYKDNRLSPNVVFDCNRSIPSDNFMCGEHKISQDNPSKGLEWELPNGFKNIHHFDGVDFEEKCKDCDGNSVKDTCDDNDGDFGDFEQFSTEPGTYKDCSESNTNSPVIDHSISLNIETLEKLLSRVDVSLQIAFDTEVTQKPTVLNLNELNDTKSSNLLEDKLGFVSGCALDELRNFGKMPELKQQWWKSPVFMSYLSAININGRAAMPAFASQLQLLEPVRLEYQSDQNKASNHANNDFDQDDQLNFDPSSIDQAVCLDQLSLSLQGQDESVNYKKVANSNNCLETVITLEDLEIELSNDPLPTVPIADYHSALLNSAKTPFDPSHCQASAAQQRPKISDMVRSTLARLPKLSYMRSNNLMFPSVQKDCV